MLLIMCKRVNALQWSRMPLIFTIFQASIYPEKLALTPQSELDFGICGADHTQAFFSPRNISKWLQTTQKTTHYILHCTLYIECDCTIYLSVWHWPMPLSCRLCFQVLLALIQLLFNPAVDRNCFELEQVKKVIIWCHYKLWFTCKSWIF